MSNKHTSGAAGIYVICLAAGQIATAWFPAYAAQIKTTAEAVQHAAVAYGLVMARDSGKPPTDGTNGTGGSDGTKPVTLAILLALAVLLVARFSS